jgi:hypothetical protein
MLQIAQNVGEFLDGKSMCNNEHDPDIAAKYLAFCTYKYKPHTIPLCDECSQKLEQLCECGSGAVSSGDITSVLDLHKVERNFDEFQKHVQATQRDPFCESLDARNLAFEKECERLLNLAQKKKLYRTNEYVFTLDEDCKPVYLTYVKFWVQEHCLLQDPSLRKDVVRFFVTLKDDPRLPMLQECEVLEYNAHFSKSDCTCDDNSTLKHSKKQKTARARWQKDTGIIP